MKFYFSLQNVDLPATRSVTPNLKTFAEREQTNQKEKYENSHSMLIRKGAGLERFSRNLAENCRALVSDGKRSMPFDGWKQ